MPTGTPWRSDAGGVHDAPAGLDPGEGRSPPVTSKGWDEDDLMEQLRTAVRQAGKPTPTMIAAGEVSRLQDTEIG